MTTSIETTDARFGDPEIVIETGRGQLGTLGLGGFEYTVADNTHLVGGTSKIVFQQTIYSLSEIQEASMKLKYGGWTDAQFDEFIESRTRSKIAIELTPGSELLSEQIVDIFGGEYGDLVKKITVT